MAWPVRFHAIDGAYIQELASHEAFARLPPPARARIFRLAGLLGLFVQP